MLVHILALSSMCSTLLCTGRQLTSSFTLGLMLFALTISFNYLLMRKFTPTWSLFALEWSLYKGVKHFSRLLTSPVPITSHTKLVPPVILVLVDVFSKIIFSG